VGRGFSYPPDLIEKLVAVLPRLVRGKDALLDLLAEGRPSKSLLADLRRRVDADRSAVSKYEMARTVLTHLNAGGDATLGGLRRVLQRVVEWTDFSTSSDTDRAVARGLVAEIQDLVRTKTWLHEVREAKTAERRSHMAEGEAALEARRQHEAELARIHQGLVRLIAASSPQARGKALEPLLNALFRAYGILLRDDFTVRVEGVGVVEQVDGAVEFDGHVYLVEMKWHAEALGKEHIDSHMMRLVTRPEARGIVVSASGYAATTIEWAGQALHQKLLVLVTLEEILVWLDQRADLRAMLAHKVQAAILDKQPFARLVDPAQIQTISAHPGRVD
jgi:hypothetical protein